MYHISNEREYFSICQDRKKNKNKDELRTIKFKNVFSTFIF